MRSSSAPETAFRTRRSMHARNAESVFPEPVGAEISVERPARIWGQPSSCGSVGVPNLWTNHSCTTGWAQASEVGISAVKFDIGVAVLGYPLPFLLKSVKIGT